MSLFVWHGFGCKWAMAGGHRWRLKTAKGKKEEKGTTKKRRKKNTFNARDGEISSSARCAVLRCVHILGKNKQPTHTLNIIKLNLDIVQKRQWQSRVNYKSKLKFPGSGCDGLRKLSSTMFQRPTAYPPAPRSKTGARHPKVPIQISESLTVPRTKRTRINNTKANKLPPLAAWAC